MPGINKFIINNNNNNNNNNYYYYYYYNYNNNDDDDDDDDDDDNKDNENDIRHLVMEYNIILYHRKAPLGLSITIVPMVPKMSNSAHCLPL